MATFNRGDTVTLSLDYDDVVTITGTASVKITPSGGTATYTNITGTNTLGAYKAYTTLVITADTAGSYTISSDTSVDTHATYATDSSGNVVGLVNPKNNGTIGLNTAKPAMKTIVIGNSITYNSQYNLAPNLLGWIWVSEIMLANMFSNQSMTFPKITASTRADAYGNYGYSGAQLATMLADLQSQLFTPLQTANEIPDLIIGHGLLENDLGSGNTYTSMVKGINQFVTEVTRRYPKAVLILCTPHPSFSYNTPTIVSNYQQIRDYILSLDNGNNIFVARLDTYENPSSPATPLSGFTDATVHPNTKGAMRNARVIASTIKRISQYFTKNFYCISGNMPYSGTGAAAGTNVTGTVPTGVFTGGYATAGSSVVSLAEQPYWNITATMAGTGVEPPNNMGSFQNATITIPNATATTRISPFIEVEIISGAENISAIEMQTTFTGSTSGSVNSTYIKRNTNDGMVEFQNGDSLFIMRPEALVTDFSASVSYTHLTLPTNREV